MPKKSPPEPTANQERLLKKYSDMAAPELFAFLVHKIRTKHGLSQKAFGKRVDVSGPYISQLETMQAVPSREFAERLWKAFAKDFEELAFDEAALLRLLVHMTFGPVVEDTLLDFSVHVARKRHEEDEERKKLLRPVVPLDQVLAYLDGSKKDFPKRPTIDLDWHNEVEGPGVRQSFWGADDPDTFWVQGPERRKKMLKGTFATIDLWLVGESESYDEGLDRRSLVVIPRDKFAAIAEVERVGDHVLIRKDNEEKVSMPFTKFKKLGGRIFFTISVQQFSRRLMNDR